MPAVCDDNPLAFDRTLASAHRQQRVGGGIAAHTRTSSADRKRSARRFDDSGHLVCRRAAGAWFSCGRYDHSRSSGRCARTQRADCVGRDECGSRDDGIVQRAGTAAPIASCRTFRYSLRGTALQNVLPHARRVFRAVRRRRQPVSRALANLHATALVDSNAAGPGSFAHDSRRDACPGAISRRAAEFHRRGYARRDCLPFGGGDLERSGVGPVRARCERLGRAAAADCLQRFAGAHSVA